MDLLVFISFVAGLFAGAFGSFAYFHVINYGLLVKTDAERKRWINKVLVRDGQAKLFPEAAIEPGIDAEPMPKASPISMASPFRRGKMALADTVKDDARRDAGSYLPPDVVDSIREAAEKVKSNGTA